LISPVARFSSKTPKPPRGLREFQKLCRAARRGVGLSQFDRRCIVHNRAHRNGRDLRVGSPAQFIE